MSSYNDTEMKVIQWAEARKIIPNSTPLAQAIKTHEELGELMSALNRNDTKEIKDAYGDILVTLVIGAALSNFDLKECFESAYQTIKNRQGYLLSNGVFVKEA